MVVRREDRTTDPSDWEHVAFDLDVEVVDGRTIIRLRGDIDAASASDVNSQIREAVLSNGGSGHVDVVLSGVTYLDMRVVGVLLGIESALRMRGREMHWVAPSRAALRTLEVLGADDVIDIHHDL